MFHPVHYYYWQAIFTWWVFSMGSLFLEIVPVLRLNNLRIERCSMQGPVYMYYPTSNLVAYPELIQGALFQQPQYSK